MMIGFFLALLFILIGIYLYIQLGTQLPTETDNLIKVVLKEKLPELISGNTGKVMNGEVSIYYESMVGQDSSRGTILLINGHSSHMLYWQPYFYQPLLDAGYRVVRYDNRGVGMSDWVSNWTKKTAFTLEDMAKDGIAVLNALQIEKAHIIGMSMGGMIAQRIAITHASRVLSLTSIMSTGYFHDPELRGLTSHMKAKLVKLTLRFGLSDSEENKLKMYLGILKALEGKGDYALDTKAVLQSGLYNIRRRELINKKLGEQHSRAIYLSGSRYDELANIKAPTLVIHGTDDPLVLFEHGQKYASMIPGAETLFIEGMGHDIPAHYCDQIHPALIRNFSRAEVNVINSPT